MQRIGFDMKQLAAFLQRDRNFSISALLQSTAILQQPAAAEQTDVRFKGNYHSGQRSLIPCESKRFSVGKREIERSQKVKQLDQIYLSRQTTTKMQQSFVRKFVQIDTALGEGIPISSNIHMKTNT